METERPDRNTAGLALVIDGYAVQDETLRSETSALSPSIPLNFD
jgi:hypothetical protein